MRLIELHRGGHRHSLNVDFITAVSLVNRGGCYVWVLGEPNGNPYLCDESYEEVIQLIKEATNDAPTVDAMEVVRCKDCRFCRTFFPEKQIGKEARRVWYCDLYRCNRKTDEYCSDGERREEV